MATIAVMVPSSPGHLNPMCSLGRSLASRGHRVVAAAFADSIATLEAAGIEYVQVATDECPLGSMNEAYQTLGGLSGLAALKYTLALMTRLGELQLRHAPPALRTIGPDIMVVDQAASVGGSVADHLGIPFVSIANALIFNTDYSVPPASSSWRHSKSPFAAVRNAIGHMALERIASTITRTSNKYRQEWNLSRMRVHDDAYSRLAQISQQPPEFEFATNLPTHLHFAGPFVDPMARASVSFPYEKLDGRPLIYASMGTLQNRLTWIFQSIAEACSKFDAQLVLSLGGSAEPESFGELPGSPLVVKFAPQLELLKRATLTITHAGMNTALESLAQGVPMVAIPITNDQPGVSSRIDWTGTGLIVKTGKLTVPRLEAAVKRVLTEPSFRTNAKRLQASIQRGRGTEYAADVIERLLETGKPVLWEDFKHRAVRDQA